MKVHWVTQEHEIVGNAFGYNAMNRALREECSKFMEFTPDADIALHIMPADLFVPIQGKINVLFTMWEMLDLPKSYMSSINRADAVMVPCSFNRDLFSKYTRTPIYTCHLGTDPDKFKFYQRSFPRWNEKFRFLWVGAPNPRKGYPIVLEAVKVFENTPNVEIYIKTTVQKMNYWQTARNIWKNRKDIFRNDQTKDAIKNMLRRMPRPQLCNRVKYFGKYKNIVFDTRRLTDEELIGLYQSAHCFLLPTFGEGWGLTLNEAMATGCPSIATAVTGVADFFDEEVGYPIGWDIKEQEIKYYDLVTRSYVPDTLDMVQKMMDVFTDYRKALRKGKDASDRVRSKFTWKQSAERLEYVLNDIQNNYFEMREGEAS